MRYGPDGRFSLFGFLLAASLWAYPAVADEDHEPMARELVAERLLPDMHRDIVIEALIEQNSREIESHDRAIIKLEGQWRSEKRDGGGPLIYSVDQSKTSTYLRTLKAESGGLYTELLVMDRRGFLIGQSDIASDYFQGDERKYLMTFPVGPGTVFVDLVEYDHSVQAIQSQVSFPILDPESGEPIGVATVGLNGSML